MTRRPPEQFGIDVALVLVAFVFGLAAVVQLDDATARAYPPMPSGERHATYVRAEVLVAIGVSFLVAVVLRSRAAGRRTGRSIGGVLAVLSAFLLVPSALLGLAYGLLGWAALVIGLAIALAYAGRRLL